MKKMKKLLSILLCLCMLAQNVPVVAFAAAEDNLCEHHGEHTDDCGYVPEAAEIVCTHEHTEECLSTTVDCTHTHGNDGCTYVPGQEAVYCGHVCRTELCGYVAASEGTSCSCVPDEDGTLTHAEGCGYEPANAGASCSFAHVDCGCAAAVEPTGECGHVCSMESGCEKSIYTCGHKDDGSCCFVAAAAGSACGYECAECAGEAEKICNCGTDAPAIHATTCAVYVAPENPQCFCAVKCTEVNEWCDVCGFDYTACTGTDMAAAYTGSSSTFVVVGNAELCGIPWDTSVQDNAMTNKGDGTYEKVFTDVPISENHRLKVVELLADGDPVWHGTSYGDDVEFAVTSPCAVTVTFDTATNAITVTGSGVAGMEFQVEAMRAVGNGDGNWLNGSLWNPGDDSNRMTEITDGIYEITYTDIDAWDDYQVRFAANGSWVNNWGGTYAGSGVETAAEFNSKNNITFSVPNDGSSVKLRLDLSCYDYVAMTGATFTITVCSSHSYGTDGKCTTCGVTCNHASYENGICTGCGAVCGHTNVDGTTCKTCGMTGLVVSRRDGTIGYIYYYTTLEAAVADISLDLDYFGIHKDYTLNQSLTLPANGILRLDMGGKLIFGQGVTLTNEGTVVLPEGTAYADIPTAITGGTVTIGEKSYAWDDAGDKWVCAEGSHVTEKDENKATCEHGAVCDVCGSEYGKKNPENHAHGCTLTYEVTEEGKHTGTYSLCKAAFTEDHIYNAETGKCPCGVTCEHDFGSDTTCDICGYICSHEDADSDAFCDICGWAHWKNVWYPVEDGSKGILIRSDTVSTYYRCGDGCAVYDAAAASLTLHNYVCEVDSDDAVIEFEDSIKIILEGTNSLTNNNYDGYGILNVFQTEVITISGGGSLTISSENIGIEAENVSIEGGNVSIYAYEEGIFAPEDSGDVEISGGVVTIESDNGHGIYTEGDIAITGGKVTITTDSNGLYAKGDDGIQITDAALKITADKKGIFSTAKNGEGIVISNSNLTISASDHAIYTEKDKNGITISDSEITVETYDSAIRTKGDESDIQITDSRIEITNGFYGIYANDSDSDVTISGGEILCNADSLIKGGYTLQNGAVQTMQEDKMLEVVSNAYLVLEEGTTLINYGQIENEGSLVNDGTIITHCTDENSYPGTVERILHIFNTIKWDNENHWYECANGHKKPDSAEVHTDEICDICGAMDLSRLEISVEGTYTYNGGTHTPVLKTGDTTLTEGVDYTAAYPEDMTNAGEKRITITGMGRYYGSNALSYTITPATPTIAWENTTAMVTYTGKIAVITEPVVTLVNGETYKGEISYAYTGTSGDEEVSGTGLPTDAGTYEITASIAGQGNYTASTSSNKLMLTIAPAPAPVITFPTVLNEITYGQPMKDVKLSFYTNAYGKFQWTAPDGVSAAGTGDYKLDFYPSEAALRNYEWKDTSNAWWIESRSALCTMGTVVVNRAPSKIETAPTVKALTYTGQPQELVNAGSVVGGTLQYSVNGGEWSEAVPIASEAGWYQISYQVVGNSNYKGIGVAALPMVQINKAKLTVTAEDRAITYGDAPATNGVTGSGFVNDESFADLSGELTYTFNYERFGDVGTYKITPAGLTSDNYDITFADGTLTVDPKVVTVTADAVSKTYGEADPALTYKVEGLVNGDELTGALSCEAGTDVGTYAIMQGTLTAGSNYAITFDGADFTINKRNITITAKDQTIFYGAEISRTEITSVGLLDGHSAAVTLTPSTTMLTENGTITASNAVIKANGADVTANYEISYEDGKLVIEFDTSVIDALDPETVNSDNQSDLEEVLETIDELLEEEGLTEEQKKTLTDAKADAQALLDVIEAAQNAMDTENTEKVEDVTADNVKPEDKEALEAAKADLEKALTDNGGNYTDKEKQDIRDEIRRIEDAVTALENAEAVEEAIKDLPETVEPDDEDDVADIEAVKKVYEELTTHEKSLVNKELREKLEALLDDAYDYDIIKGDGGKWTKGSDGSLSFTANGPFSKFIGIEVDGREVDEKYYDAKSGSTIITLKKSFLKKLSTGKHTITVLYTDGETSGTFKIRSESDIPATGDEFNLMLHSTMLAVSISGLIMLILASKKRKKTN